MISSNPRVQEITSLVSKLTDEDQEALLKALKIQILLAQARRLDQSVRKNKVSMDEIISVVRQVRQTRHQNHASS
jgi:hypothetical protein